MADNIAITAGSGTTVATDEVTIDGALAHVQRVKPVHGVAGAAVDVSRADGLPVSQGVLTTTGTMAGVGQTVALACAGMASVAVQRTAGGLTTIMVEASLDGGTTYSPFPVLDSGGSSNPATGGSSLSSSLSLVLGGLPPGATHVRARALTATSVTVSLVVTAAPVSTVVVGLQGAIAIPTVSASLASNNASVGFVRAQGIWQDDTVTPLAGAGTFTGTARDLTATAAASGFSGNGSTNGSGTVEMRGLAVSDVAGTLHLEVSRDNTTFRRIKSVATAAVGGSGLHVAEIEHKPKTRYARWVYVNDAGAQTHFMVQTFLLSA